MRTTLVITLLLSLTQFASSQVMCKEQKKSFAHFANLLALEGNAVLLLMNFTKWKRKPAHQLRCGWDESDPIQSQ